MDGLNFKIADQFSQFFVRDTNGLYIPSSKNLLMEYVVEKFGRQLQAKYGFYQRLASIIERTDVVFPNNPHGNTPVIGFGWKACGPRPLKPNVRDNIRRDGKISQSDQKRLDKRQRIINENTKSLLSCLESLQPKVNTPQLELLYKVEHDQALTGQGFDGNKIGDVHYSGLNFVNHGYSFDHSTMEDSVLSKLVVDGCIWVASYLEKSGLRKGSLEPMSGLRVRAEQDTDGLMGAPVCAPSQDEWTIEYASRMLIWYGVDTRDLVGKQVHDKYNDYSGPTRVVDALCYILEAKNWSYEELFNLIIFLARIQKHGCKEGPDGIEPKDGKTRSVYLGSAMPALVEAMIFAPFNDKLKELKVSIMPSLQDKPTRVDMIMKMLTDARARNYDYLAADWSKYDAGVLGCVLATVIQLAVKPFFNAKYYYWVDVATYILVYKYLIFDTNLASIHEKEFSEAKRVAPWKEFKNYTLIGCIDGLVSGAKFTHVGGSLYGETVIHYCIPKLLGWEPIPGPQAGDDTLMGAPLDRIHLDSSEKTYAPIRNACLKFNLDMNLGKQIFHSVLDEIVKVFLQDNYHINTDTRGIGSIFRPAAAVFYSEREKGLSINEQLVAEIARMNNGADSPFADDVVLWWLNQERYLGWLFKEYGVSGFKKLTEAIGLPIKELAQRIDVGSFSFGISRRDMESGNLPILPVMARVSNQMEFTSSDRIPNWTDNGTDTTEDVDGLVPDSDTTQQLDAEDDSE